MQIVQKSIDVLIPYENNPRDNDNAVEAVANSIKEFGFKVPIVIDSDNVIVCGHTRLKASRRLGLDTVPCVVADDLTEEQIQAFRLADNKTAELATWDFEKLDLELETLEMDMVQFGFDEPEEEPTEVIEDEVPEEAEPRCKTGDVWRLGAHKLMCGDATDI